MTVCDKLRVRRAGRLTKVKKKKKQFMMPNAKLALSMEQFLPKSTYGKGTLPVR